MTSVQDRNKTTLMDQTYNQILSMIQKGTLDSSGFISHRFLAEKLKISKQPIVFALRQLEEDGIVESAPRVGTRIRQITAKDMWGMLQWRIGLEMRTTALACQFGSDEELEQLCTLAHDLDEKINDAGNDIDEIRKLDTRFHMQLAKLSGCERLCQELSKLNVYHLKSILCEAVRITREELPLKPAVCHATIASRIRERNSRQAAELMEQHLEQSSDMKKFVSWYKSNNIQK